MKKALLSLLSLWACAHLMAGNWTNFSTATRITSIAIRNNQVWVAAKGGLMMYDKSSGAKTFFLKSTTQLPSLTIERVLVHPQTNDIWIGTYDNGLAFMHNNSWTQIPFPVEGTLLYEMKMTPSGVVWCATTEGLYKYENNQFTLFPAGETWDIDLFPNGKILCGGHQPFIFDPSNNQVIMPSTTAFAYGQSSVYVRNDSTYYYSGDRGELAEFNDTTEVDTIHIPMLMRDMRQYGGQLYMLREDLLLFEKTGGAWNNLSFGDSNLSAFTFDGNGELWGGSAQDGNKLFHQNNVIDIKRSDIATNWVTQITRAEDGNVLLVGPEVVQKFDLDANAFTDAWYTPIGNVGEVLQKDGKLYAGSSYQYLNIYTPQTGWQLKVGEGILPAAEVDHLAADAQDNIWLCGPGYVARYNGSNFTIYNSSYNNHLTPNLYLRDIHYDVTRNVIWVASYEGIFKIDGSTVSFYNESTPGIQQYYDAVEVINEDAAHNIWFGTIYGGVLKFNGSAFSTMLLPQTAGNQFISGIEFIDNAMYVTDNLHGVWIYENNQWDSLNMRNSPLTSDYISASYADKNGNLWLGNLLYGADVYNRNGTTVAIKDAGQTAAKVFPNPAKGWVTIELPEAAAINIMDIKGQIIQQLRLHAGSNTLNLSGEAPGMYVAQIKGSTYQNTFKLVLQ